MGTEFVRLSQEERIYGEKNFLQSQLEMLNLMKNFRSYKELRKAEFSLKISLKARIGEAFDLMDKFDARLPKTEFRVPRGSRVKGRKIKLSVHEEMEELKGKLAKLQEGM